MATNFPTSLDDNTILGADVANATPVTDPLHNVDAQFKNNSRDALKAVEAKVGIDGSVDTASLDYKVTQLEAGPVNPLIIHTGDQTSYVAAPASRASMVLAHTAGGVSAEVSVESWGSGFAMGYVDNGPGTGYAGVNARGKAAMAFGYIWNADDGWSGIYARSGALAHGYIDGMYYTSEVLATAYGSQAHGFVRGANGTGVGYGNAYVKASGKGSHASGYAFGYGHPLSGPNWIYAGHHGSFAHGHAYGASIQALREGAFVCGKARTGGKLDANGDGSFCHGYVRLRGEIGTEQSGSFATGYAADIGSYVQGFDAGCFASGWARESGRLRAEGSGGCHALGKVRDGEIRTWPSTSGGALAGGYALAVGKIYSYGKGTFAWGYASDIGRLNAQGKGTAAWGYADWGGRVFSEGYGALAFGAALYGNSTTRPIPDEGTALVHADGMGSFALGYASGGDGDEGWAKVEADGDGCFAMGWAYKYTPNVWSQITARSPLAQDGGAFAFGFIDEGGKIEAYGNGCFAGGAVSSGGAQTAGDLGGALLAAGDGAFAFGRVDKSSDLTSVASLEASGHGSWAGGYVDSSGAGFTGLIQATQKGSFAHGVVYNAVLQSISAGAQAFGHAKLGGVIEARDRGAFASGYVNASYINAQQPGSFAHGAAYNGYEIFANGVGSVAFGQAVSDNIRATAANAFQFGQGTNAVTNSLQVGAGFSARATGQFGGANVPETLGVAATSFSSKSNLMTITGDGGGNTVATISGGFSGQELTLIFVDVLVTITDDPSGAANTVNLSAAFTSAAGKVLKLVFNGTSWYEVSRSTN